MNKEHLLLFTLAAVQFLHILDFMIIMPLGSQFMRVFDISPQQFSIIVSVYAISAFGSGLINAIFIDRFDRRKALTLAFLGFTIGTFACYFSLDYSLFLVSRCITGAFGGIISALVFAIIGDVFPLERRASAMGIVMMAFSVASVVGVPAGVYLAATFSWRMPFLVIGAGSVLLFFLMGLGLPSMQNHLTENNTRQHFLAAFKAIYDDPNQLKALTFSIILILGHFTIIPFIAPYMQLNIGFSDMEVSYIYFIGGLFTAFLLPLFGKLADRYGNVRVFTISSFFALFSIFAITHLPPVSMIIALCATSSYFVVASGRSVPAHTIVTAVVRPESRGSFMSIRSSLNEMGLALSSLIAGLIITERPDGSLENYQWVGYIAIGMSLVAILLAKRLKLIDNN